MRRVLFVASHRPDRSPSQRFRFEQYIGWLEGHGFECELSYLVSEADDRFLYRPGNYVRKALFTWRASRKRAADARRVGDFDVVLVQREALMTRSIAFEEAVARSRAKLIVDFDDSVWLQNVSAANRLFAWMKNPGKTSELIGLADLVFAGNDYLARYARRFNDAVVIVPTTIDTEEYRRQDLPTRDAVCIGWSGSITTIQHFERAIPFLRAIKERFGDRVVFKVIGDATYRHEGLGIVGQGWSKDTEVRELSGIDIGIMPLPDDEWARGKCGLKGLQYMALETPTIMSPVGVNTEIIEDGVDGFLADTDDRWVERLAALVEDDGLRRRVGAAARRTVAERYSVLSQREAYLGYFRTLAQG